MNLRLSFTSDQNWHINLYATSAGGKHLSNDAQIRVIGRMEPKICTKMLQKLSENLRAKFPVTTPGFSIVKIARLEDASLKGHLLVQNFDFSACPSQNVIKLDAEWQEQQAVISQIQFRPD